MRRQINIIIIETSPIILEGLVSILNKLAFKCNIEYVASLEEIALTYRKSYELAIINPSFIQNSPKSFNALKSEFSNTKWLGLQYSFYDQKTLSLLDATITISNTPEFIINTIHKLLVDENQQVQGSTQDVLSEREIDVLKLLATGMSNKEIADKLNISANTVITHRKNISQKTGIKSISGLTIFAVVQKLISVDGIKE